MLALVLALFPSTKPPPFHPRLSPFPRVSMQLSSHPSADGLGVDLGLSRLTPLTLRGQSISHLCPVSAGLFLQKLGHQAPLFSGRSPKAFPPHGPSEDSAAERGVSAVLLPHGFNNSSSSLGELSAVINSVPFSFKIGLRKMPGCLIFKLNV